MTESPPSDSNSESPQVKQVAAFIAGGGMVTSGVALAGTATLGIGLLPVAALGMVLGLSAYGIKHALFDDSKSAASTTETTALNNSATAVETNDATVADMGIDA